ncbi:hypothetical protein [Nocardia jinanensis]|uniref:SMP domain-containing protein n=1 Tax=Nocardia jinanensis TaxID=382504 RepID=A0A917RYC4_9NOCA|nr:hypothetical protein [Nocardia jinanensis]GGL44269.1 hypothetical protein GCM10011588_68740 [Nocardia jinanensis]
MSKSGGRGHSGGKMTSSAASRIQSAADKNPDSSSAQSGFASRAQSSAAKSENETSSDRK